MTEQLTPERATSTAPAIRNELWESRHVVASLRLEIQRGDEEYAALAAAYAAEQRHGARLTADLATVTADLQDALTAAAAATTAQAASIAANAAAVAARDELAAALGNVLAERDAAVDAANVATAQMARMSAERDAWLRTRTVRWTRAPRRLWGWWLRRAEP